MKKTGDPGFVTAGIKLASTANVVDGKFTKVNALVDPQEFESPVLGGIKPVFTKVSNLSTFISKDGLTAKIHYDVQTQLSNFEVMGQWGMTLLSGTVQTNVITVTQSVDIELKVGSIRTTFDGSTFPESRYEATYTINTGAQILKGPAS